MTKYKDVVSPTKENTELELGLTELELVEKQKKIEIQNKIDKITDYIYENLQKIAIDINKEGLRYPKDFEQIFLAEKVLGPEDRSGYKYQRLVLELEYFGTWVIKSYNCTKVLKLKDFPVLETNFDSATYSIYHIHSETVKSIDVGFDDNYGRYSVITQSDLEYSKDEFPFNTKVGELKIYKKYVDKGKSNVRDIVERASVSEFYGQAVRELIKNIKNNQARLYYKKSYVIVYNKELESVKKDVKTELNRNNNIDSVLGEIE